MRSARKSVRAKPAGKQAARQVEVDALKHQIHKLRWMGMDREAETVCARLSRLAPGVTVPMDVHATD